MDAKSQQFEKKHTSEKIEESKKLREMPLKKIKDKKKAENTLAKFHDPSTFSQAP